MTEKVYIGIDLGGTRIRAGKFNANLERLARTETLTLDEEGVEAVIARIIAQARAVWADSSETVVAVGVSAPGPIDLKTGVITRPPNLAGWRDVPLKRRLEEALGVPVYLGNDANLAALAEYERGAGRGFQHVIYLTISTGIGAGIIVDGNLIVGWRGFGAEGGHLAMMVYECGQMRATTLEREAQGGAIARQAQVAIVGGRSSAILALAGGDVRQIETRHVVEAARKGDPLGLELLRRAGTLIGLGIVSLLHLFNPEIIIMGGGVAEGAGDLLLTPAWEAIKANVLDETYYQYSGWQLQIVPPLLGEDVSLIGAAALAMRGRD
ncbi:MAG: ROK family protein [Aggregatilineales bacterium]